MQLEKLLKEWKRYLLNESAFSAQQLLETEAMIKVSKGAGSITVSYLWPQSFASAKGVPFRGNVQIAEAQDERMGYCLDAYIVIWSSADKGYGPLLYDIAIEIATEYGGGLTPDPEEVSNEAQAVWDYYFSKRKDVQHTQLDDEENALTPIYYDNCNQDQAKRRFDDDWHKSSLSKVYKKQMSIVPFLLKHDKIWLAGFD